MDRRVQQEAPEEADAQGEETLPIGFLLILAALAWALIASGLVQIFEG